MDMSCCCLSLTVFAVYLCVTKYVYVFAASRHAAKTNIQNITTQNQSIQASNPLQGQTEGGIVCVRTRPFFTRQVQT